MRAATPSWMSSIGPNPSRRRRLDSADHRGNRPPAPPGRPADTAGRWLISSKNETAAWLPQTRTLVRTAALPDGAGRTRPADPPARTTATADPAQVRMAARAGPAALDPTRRAPRSAPPASSVTALHPDGTAAAHGCARGRHPAACTQPRWPGPAPRGRDDYPGSGPDRGRTTAISVAAKSSPRHRTGCPVRSASAYVKQSPKFSPAG
jgi:hypothetical protein